VTAERPALLDILGVGPAFGNLFCGTFGYPMRWNDLGNIEASRGLCYKTAE
jgi:hypothetical protein